MSVLVCFDLGRVLVRICDSWSHAHARAGLEGEIDAAAVASALAEHTHGLEVDALTVEAYLDEVARLFQRDAAEIAAMLDAWLIGAMPGATALLDELSGRGHAIACLSNTNARHWQLMSGWSTPEAQLFGRMHHRYGSHELGLRKPDPAIYAEVERRSGHAAEQIVFFDDLADNVSAARSRGWRAVEVRSREDPVAEMREWLGQAKLLG